MKIQSENNQWAVNRMIKKAGKLNNKLAELKYEAASYGIEVWGENITVVSPYKNFRNPVAPEIYGVNPAPNPFVLLVEEACK